MKKFLFLLLTISSLYASSQNVTQTVIRRITATSGTIPASDTVTGVVKIDTTYSTTYKYLRYIGTTNIANTFPSGSSSYMYIYIPSDSCLARVLSVAAVGDATLDTFRIQVDRVMPFVASKAFKSIKAKTFGYSFQNDGGANGYANSVMIKTGETLSMSRVAIEGTGTYSAWQEPVIINATGTDFLIIERKAQ